MITGANLLLRKPKIVYQHNNLKKNREIYLLLYSIREYFKQKNVIYDADLVLSNNEYERKYTDYGPYNQRIDYTIPLRYLNQLILTENELIFIDVEDEQVKVPVKKDFFYTLEWEENYYL